ncbi:MAG: hypothetical protein EAZ97_11280 [Bacteroidetes bacterium]|nr:MAG: hypothetical protein EAZ97_11280 [Bacteroidota bacterium]
MKKIFYIFSFVCATLLLDSCKKEEKTTDSEQTKLDSVQVADVKNQLDSLIPAIDSAWAKLDNEDFNKLAVGKKLAEQIGKLPKANKKLLDSVAIYTKAVESSKYDQMSMADSKLIDKFDSAVVNFISVLKRLQKETPNVNKCADCEALLKFVIDIDDKDVIRRKKYDELLFKYNEIVKNKRKFLEALGGKYMELKEKPVFTIPANS